MVPLWYVIHTHSKQEVRAECNLRGLNIETFAPQLKVRRQNSFTGEFQLVVKPLFTGYIFARFDLDSLLHKVRFTRGVHSLVSVSDGPVPLSEEMVDCMRGRVASDGFVHIGSSFNRGDRVVIKEGPLKNLTGIFEKEMKDSERVMILLDAVEYQARVLVDRNFLTKAISAG